MAIQDDIMAMLSQVSDAGDRATDRGRTGSEMYSQMADLLSGDNRSKAMREIAMLSDNPEMSIEEQMRFDPLTGSRVADIIEKYMDDAGDGVPATVPDDMIVDDTRAAERMMEVMPSPDTAPRTPVTTQPLKPLPPMPGRGPGEAGMLMVDDTGAAMQGQGMDEIREEIMSKSPRLQELLIQESMGGARSDPGRAADLQQAAIRNMGETARKQGVYGTQGARIRAAAGEETGLSGALLNARMGREATPEDEVSAILDSLVYGGAPLGGIAALSSGVLSRLAMRLGVGRFSPGQLGRNPALRSQVEKEIQLALPKPAPQLALPKPTAGASSSYVAPSAQVGAQARQAAQAAARARQAAAARARQAARGERSGPDIPITPSPAQRLGSTQGSGSAFDDLINRLGPIGMAGGMSVRDNILRNYAMMDDGGYVDDEETKRIEDMNRRMDEATRDYLKGFPQGFVRDVRGLIDSDERLLNKAAKENIKAQGRRNFKRAYGMADGGYVATGEQGNYNENVVQQMRRLKREFGTDEAVDLMREMYPEYRIGNSGLIMGKPKRSNDDSFPVPNAPFEMIQNYLRHGHVLGKDYRDLKKKQ